MEEKKQPPEQHGALHDPKLPRLNGEERTLPRLVNRRSAHTPQD